MELAKAEQRVAAKALEQEKAIREAIARGEKSEADLDAFDKSFRDQIRAKAADQAAAAEKKLTPDQAKRDEAQRQAEAKLLAQAAAEQKKAADELAKGKPQSAAVAQREAETKLSQGHATEGTQRLQQAAGKAAEAAAKASAQQSNNQNNQNNPNNQTRPSLKNAQEAQKAAAEALDRERALREAMKKGEASSAELDALDRANRAAADEVEKNLEAAQAADKVADLATAAEAQAAAQKPAPAAEDEAPAVLADYKAVLDYVAEHGRKLAKTKLYADVSKGRLKKQPDGTFRPRDVDRYLVSLPLAGTPEGLTEKVADRQRRKEEADIRKAEAQAKREEFNLAVAQGKFLPRDQIAAELAVRAVALRDALKNAMESAAGDVIELVGGDPKQTSALLEYMGRLFDRSMGDYARPLDIVLEISGVVEGAEDGDDE